MVLPCGQSGPNTWQIGSERAAGESFPLSVRRSSIATGSELSWSARKPLGWSLQHDGVLRTTGGKVMAPLFNCPHVLQEGT